ncbi:MAG: hypothetical protein H7Y22_06600, partial [Gemmatimonadaceae bacterium]|nr:hypothetical protein [Gloeobacterales cyanobacterium ES-bin-141]
MKRGTREAVPAESASVPAAYADNLEFRQRLRRLAEVAGSVNALAKRSNVLQSTLRHYLNNGGEPTRPVLVALCTSMDVCLEWLALGKGPMRRETHLDAPDDGIPSPSEGVPKPDEAICGPPESLVVFGERWLAGETRFEPSCIRTVRVEGDAMEPTLR